jgi:hypothetical protein
MKRKIFFGAVLFFSLCCSFADGKQTPEERQKEFQKLLQKLKPKSEDDLWLKIPWQIDLLKAQVMAAKEGKPVFMWAMNGHPLGCV